MTLCPYFSSHLFKNPYLSRDPVQTSKESGCEEEDLAGTQKLDFLWDQLPPGLGITFPDTQGNGPRPLPESRDMRRK